MIPDYVEEIGAFWVLKNDNAITVNAREHGTIAYDKTFLELPELDTLPKGALILDAGAFIGDSTRIFLDKGFRVIAFEPQLDAFACLKHNCPDAVNLNLPLGDGRMIDLEVKEAGNMGARVCNQGYTHRTSTLDDFSFQGVALIKLDCEGFEPAILQGAKHILRCPELRFVICEINPQSLQLNGWTEADIFKYFKGWNNREVFRYYESHWDVIFWRT